MKTKTNPLVFTEKLKPHVTLKGNGTSLWGNTKDVLYDARSVTFEIYPWSLNPKDDSVRGTIDIAVGRKNDWMAYTDQAVEMQVAALVKKTFPLLQFEYIGWSEQGMQSNFNMNFDFMFTEKTSQLLRMCMAEFADIL